MCRVTMGRLRVTIGYCSITSGGIYGISRISMDIPEISMFQDPATHCHQIRQHTLTLYLVTGDMKQLRMSTFKE